MSGPTRDAVACALYELDPYVAPQEYLGVMGTDGQGILQLVGGGPYSWAQAVEADAVFGGLSFYEPLTARAYRMADAALGRVADGRVVELYLATDDAGNIYQDTRADPKDWAKVYAAFVALRDEIARQIAQRRACPHNPKYGTAQQQVQPAGR